MKTSTMQNHSETQVQSASIPKQSQILCNVKIYDKIHLTIMNILSPVQTLAIMPRLCSIHVGRCSKVYLFDRHIYVPLGGSQHGLMRQVLASFLCFVFIFLWHGAEFYLFVWTFLNYFGILLESMAAQVSAIPSVKAFEVNLHNF